MKFSNVIAISLSLGCQVLAAPAPPTPTPAAAVEALAADAPTARSLPVGVPDIAVIKGAVSELRSSVSGELSTISKFRHVSGQECRWWRAASMSASDAPSYDIPIIKKSLANIATHMKAATTGMAPALVGSTIALTAEEAQALLCALNEIEAIVYNIKLALSSLLSTIGAGKLFSPSYLFEICKVSLLTTLFRRQVVDRPWNRNGSWTGHSLGGPSRRIRI